ncbi:hypothetical protein LINPERPRIM_LOCUS19932 [Linum perenne]
MNAEGQVVDGRAGRFLCSSPIVSEARAILEAVKFASPSVPSSRIASLLAQASRKRNISGLGNALA